MTPTFISCAFKTINDNTHTHTRKRDSQTIHKRCDRHSSAFTSSVCCHREPIRKIASNSSQFKIIDKFCFCFPPPSLSFSPLNKSGTVLNALNHPIYLSIIFAPLSLFLLTLLPISMAHNPLLPFYRFNLKTDLFSLNHTHHSSNILYDGLTDEI